MQKVVVSQAGASVYSASELAATAFPQLDVSLRGAVSIARRLQDPLAELVSISPQPIRLRHYLPVFHPFNLPLPLLSPFFFSLLPLSFLFSPSSSPFSLLPFFFFFFF